jgi:hypothetical protein
VIDFFRGRPRLSAFLILLLAEWVAFRLFISACGFYHDDWIFLEMLQKGGGFWGAAKIFAGRGHWLRPVQIIQLPLFYSLSHSWPPAGQLILAGLELCEGWFLFLLIRRITKDHALALCAAVFALLFPNRDVVHFWLSNASQLLAHVLVLSGMLLHVEGLAGREEGQPGSRQGVARIFFGQLLFLTGVLTYESVSFLFFLPAGALLAGELGSGRGWKAALLRVVRGYWPFAASLALAVLWQRLGATFFFGAENPKSLGLSIGHTAKVFAAGLECSSNRALHNCAKSFWSFLREFGRPGPLALWAGTALFLGWFLCREHGMDGEHLADRMGKGLHHRVIGLLLGGYIGAYLPYAFSRDYSPAANGLMSRTSASGAWVGALALAWGVLSLLRASRGRFRTWARGLCVLAVAAFLCADWSVSLSWSKSWRIQQAILRGVSERIADLPDPVTVLVRRAPSYIGPAVVFDSHYDLDSALRLFTARPGVHATMFGRRIFFVKDGVEERLDGALLRKYGYDGLYSYDYGRKDLVRIPDLRSAQRLFGPKN